MCIDTFEQHFALYIYFIPIKTWKGCSFMLPLLLEWKDILYATINMISKEKALSKWISFSIMFIVECQYEGRTL